MRAATTGLVISIGLLAGCGGGGDSGGGAETGASSVPVAPQRQAVTTTAAPAVATRPGLDADALAKALNQLCRGANRKIGAIKARKTSSSAEEAEAVADARRVFDRTGPAIDALVAGDGADAGALARYKRSARRDAGLVRRLERAVRAGDQAEIKRISAALDRSAAVRLDAALDLGADDCGQ